MTRVRLVKVGKSLMVTIPRWFCVHLNLMRGDDLEVRLDGDGVRYVSLTPHKVGTAAPTVGGDRRVNPRDEEDE